jgi:hypothetical protein
MGGLRTAGRSAAGPLSARALMVRNRPERSVTPCLNSRNSRDSRVRGRVTTVSASRRLSEDRSRSNYCGCRHGSGRYGADRVDGGHLKNCVFTSCRGDRAVGWVGGDLVGRRNGGNRGSCTSNRRRSCSRRVWNSPCHHTKGWSIDARGQVSPCGQDDHLRLFVGRLVVVAFAP